MKKVITLLSATCVIVFAAAELDALPDWAQSLSNPYLNRTFLRIFVWQWLCLGILLAISILVGLVVNSVLRKAIRFRNRLTHESVTDPTYESIGRSTGLLAGTLFFKTLSGEFNLPLTFSHDLDIVISAITIFAGVLLTYAWWDVLCDSLQARAVGHQRAERLLIPITRKLVRACIIVGGILVAIASYGGSQTVMGLIGTLGISGIVIALAAKDSVENLFGSLTVMFDMPFALGDWVRIDKVEGTVEEINLRSTRIRTSEDTVINLPNANLIRASVENFGSRRFRRLKLVLRLSYDCQKESIETYRAALLEYLNNLPELEKDNLYVTLVDPTEASIGLSVDGRMDITTYSDEVRMKHIILEEAMRLRPEHKIVFAAAPRPNA
jgi:MscS family membrane protein